MFDALMGARLAASIVLLATTSALGQIAAEPRSAAPLETSPPAATPPGTTDGATAQADVQAPDNQAVPEEGNGPFQPPRPGSQQYRQQTPSEPTDRAEAHRYGHDGERRPEIRLLSFALRIGYQLGGTGTLQSACDGTCNQFVPRKRKYDLHGAAVVAADLLYGANGWFRLGPSLTYTHSMGFAPDGAAGDFDFGNFTDVDAAFEAAAKVSDTWWLIPRLAFGLSVFRATGTLSDDQSAAKVLCQSQATLAASSGGDVSGCSSFDNPHLGFNASLGFGAMFGVSRQLRVRLDVLGNYHRVGLDWVKQTSNGTSTTLSDRFSGFRYLMLAGIEF